MQIKPKNHSIDSLFAFLLLLTFTLFTLMLAGMGSAIYRNGASYLDENYTSRTAVAYVTEKVRQHDVSGSIFMTKVEETPALAFRDTIDGESYLTYVYFYDGALRELFIEEDREPSATLGNRIVTLSSLTIEAANETAGTDEAADGADAGEVSSGGNEDDTHLLLVTAVSEHGNELSQLIHISSE